MLLSKPFTLNYSIELPESNTHKKHISMALEKKLAKLFISFILTILFNYIQGLLLIGKAVIQKMESRED